MDLLSPLTLAVSVTSLFVGATVLSAAGFGMGMVALPFLLLVVDPVTAILTLNTTQILLYLVVLRDTRRDIHTGEVRPLAVVGIAGAVLGVFVLTASAEAVLRVLTVALILGLAVLTAVNPRPAFRAPQRLGPALGFGVAVLLGTSAIGGPIMALYALGRGWERDSVRGTLAAYFMAVMVVLVVGYVVAGIYTAERAAFIGIAVGPVLVGAFLGTRLSRYLSDAAFRRAVVVIIISTSIAVLVRELAF
jgi:uncharacterized membrane protein YfcA